MPGMISMPTSESTQEHPESESESESEFQPESEIDPEIDYLGLEIQRGSWLNNDTRSLSEEPIHLHKRRRLRRFDIESTPTKSPLSSTATARHNMITTKQPTDPKHRRGIAKVTPLGAMSCPTESEKMSHFYLKMSTQTPSKSFTISASMISRAKRIKWLPRFEYPPWTHSSIAFKVSKQIICPLLVALWLSLRINTVPMLIIPTGNIVLR